MEDFTLLKDLINENSWSYNTAGIQSCVSIIEAYVKHHTKSYVIKRATCEEKPDLLIITKEGFSTATILLSGHLDTVHQPGKTQINYLEDKNTIKGDGVSDMKGGIFVMIRLLELLDSIDLNITAVFNIDEEIGSATYAKKLSQLYQTSNLALVFEASGTNNSKSFSLVTQRKGFGIFVLETFGERGHSGNITTRKDRHNAIEELAIKASEIIALQDFNKGTTINLGLIQGGVTINTIPDYAKLEFEMRIKTTDEANRVLASLDSIQQEQHTPGVQTKLTAVTFVYPLFESKKTHLYYDQAGIVAKELNCSLIKEYRNGGSDANHIRKANNQVAIFDGLGPYGENAHTKAEWISKENITQQIEFAKRLIEKVAKEK